MSHIWEMETAYKILPPPLAALPAKYWTSISLWFHSYTVARTFQEFVESYSIEEAEVPPDEEAFLIGLLHDLGQKLQLRGRPSEERLLNWVRESLEDAGYTRGEAEEFSRYLYTNPAETLSDPLYDKSVWRLLWLADRLQGIDNPLAIEQLLTEAREDLGKKLATVLLNVTIPQPFMRTLISKIVHEKITRMAEHKGILAIPVTTPFGLVVITESPSLSIDLDWEEIRRRHNGDRIIPEEKEADIEWNMRCCEDSQCRARCSTRKKPQECKDHGFTKRDCEKGLYPGSRGNSYRITLLYFGSRRVPGDIILPKDVEPMFQGIALKNTVFAEGTNTCPICGVRTPVGVVGDFLQSLNSKITTEQWARKLYPASVNRLMQEVKDYAVDPLCMGEAILRGNAQYTILMSLTLRAIVPLSVLEEVGRLMWSLMGKLGSGVPKASVVDETMHGHDSFQSLLGKIVKNAVTADTPNFYYDAFTSTVVIPYRDRMQRHQDEWVRDIITAGVFSAWGLYPLSISEAVPPAPGESLLSYYKGRKPLYDYQPNDRRIGGYTPYVSTTMMALSELNLRSSKESLPALLEVLDYPPEHSPLLLEYGSPSLYSRLENLRFRIGVRA